MISHTHLKASYLPDTTPLIKRPSSWQPSSSYKTAPELADPRRPLKPHVVLHTGVQKARPSMPGCDWHPRSSASKTHVLQWGKITKIFHSAAVANAKVIPFEASPKLLPLHDTHFLVISCLCGQKILSGIWEFGEFPNLTQFWSDSCRRCRDLLEMPC